MAQFNQYTQTEDFSNEGQWLQVVCSIIAVFIVAGWMV